MKRFVLGRSVEGRRIEAYLLPGLGERTTLVLGGMHGDEPKSVYVVHKLIELLHTGIKSGKERDWIVVPIVNPDGYERRKRRNANAVDINRNFPTRDWTCTSPRSRMFGGEKPASEPETRAVIRIIEQCLSKPQAPARGLSNLFPASRDFVPGSALHARPSALRIISIHSIDGQRHCNNYDGPARAMATAMRRRNGYPVTKSIGYSTPGSFGTWAGRERRIPIITLELPSHHSPKRCWEDNCQALCG